MTKRIIALLMALLMLALGLASCGNKEDEDDRGAYISMYIADEVYDFDPANAYNNASALKIVSLLFSPLFTLDENGNVKKELVSSYAIDEDQKAGEYKLTLKLKTSYWSDGTQISANDVVFAWKRILEVESSSEAASLLFDIKNARKVKSGDCSIDDLRVYAVNTTTLEIYFEEKLDENGKPDIDYDGFMRNLTSYALVPLREMIVSRTADWAKKPATMVCSGPFTIRKVSYEEDTKGLTLERNAYYMRDKEKDALDKSVTPYRLIIDYTKSEEEIMQAYEAGEIFYVGEIPLSARAIYADKAEVSDAMSTHTYYLNENVEINGTKLFAIKEVRQALSLAIDREAIADTVVFAKAANALVPYGIFNGNSSKKDFRTVGGSIISTSADMSAAKDLLTKAGIKASEYSFKIMVAEYDEVHMAIAEAVCSAWSQLGFKVTIDAVKVIVNDDVGTTNEVPTDIKDDIFQERFVAGDYQVAAVDLVAYSTDAFSMLAPFALGFSGQGMNMDLKDENGQPYYVTPTHITGFNNDSYNALIEQAYAEADVKEKAVTLHEAERYLLDEMPVIPIVFNQDAYLSSKKLSGTKETYYSTRVFSKTKLKNYKDYLPEEAK